MIAPRYFQAVCRFRIRLSVSAPAAVIEDQYIAFARKSFGMR